MLRGVTAMEEEYDEIFEHLTGECELKFNRRDVVIKKCSKNQLSSKFQKIHKNKPAMEFF